MIDKIHKLKQLQRDQLLIKKQKLLTRINDIEAEINFIKDKILSSSVNNTGKMNDFFLLQMHKNALRTKIKELESEKVEILMSIDILNEDIIKYEKESQQFEYILNEQKKERFKQIIKQEEMTAYEYSQSQFIQKNLKKKVV